MDTAAQSRNDPPMTALSYRRATAADAPLFEAWDRLPHVRAAVSADGSEGFGADWPAELEDDCLAYVVVSDDAGPIGFLAAVDPAADPYWGDMPPGLRALDIIIGDPARLGQGHGTAMMRWALDRCFADPSVEAVLVDPLAGNARAIRFYRRLGFADLERRRFDDGSDCLLLRLDRATWQHP
jgi:aminoglycoside 6'-N-acetyltransferase